MGEKILDLDDVIQGGIQPSLFGSKVQLWIDGKNVVFQKGGIRPMPGQVSVANKISNGLVTAAVEARILGTRTVFWGTVRKPAQGIKGKLFRLKEGEGTPVDVSRTGASAAADYDLAAAIELSIRTQDATTWSFVQWGDTYIVATDGIHPVQLYTASSGRFQDFDIQASVVNGSATVTGIPTTGELVFRIKEFLFLANTNLGDNVIEWSDEDNIGLAGAWVPDPANAAGNLKLHESNSPLVCCAPLGQGMGLYGTDQLFVVNYIGPPFYFGYDLLLSGIGAVGKNAVCVVGKQHYGVSQRGFFVTDGVNFEYLDDPLIRDYLFTQGNAAGTFINKEQICKCFVWHDPAQSSVNMFYPKGPSTECNWGVGFNYVNKSSHILGFGRSAGTSGEVFYFPFLFGTEGDIFQEVVGDTAPSVGNSPLTLDAVYSMTTGWNFAGYGEGGYGGKIINGDG